MEKAKFERLERLHVGDRVIDHMGNSGSVIEVNHNDSKLKPYTVRLDEQATVFNKKFICGFYHRNQLEKIQG